MKQAIAAVAVCLALASGTATAQDGILGRIGKGLMQAGTRARHERRWKKEEERFA